MDLHLKFKRILARWLGILTILVILFGSIISFHVSRFVENVESKKNIERASKTLEIEIGNLAMTCADWANWTATYNFASHQSSQYVLDNLSEDNFRTLQVNIIEILNKEGKAVFSKTYDKTADSQMSLNPYAGIPKNILPLFNGSDSPARSGILFVNGHPALIAIGAIMKSDRTGPQNGFLVFGRYLDDVELAKISEAVQLPVSYLILIDAETRYAAETSLAQRKEIDAYKNRSIHFAKTVENGVETTIFPLSFNKIASYRPFKDMNGNTSFLLRVESPRDIFHLEVFGALAFLISLLFIASLNTILFANKIKKIIVNPISKISESLGTIGNSVDSKLLHYLPDFGDDEIGALGKSINNLVLNVNEHHLGLKAMVDMRTKELEAANKELAAFSYSVSHDLRAPLRGIEGFTQIFINEYGADIPEKGRGYLERVKKNTIYMDQLINDLLMLSRLSREEVSLENTDISALATETVSGLIMENPGRDIQAKIEPDMNAYCDSHLIRIVLNNLLGNAWKYTSKREHAIVEIGAVSVLPSMLAFFVRDNGVGFDEAYKDRLFGAFQRLHSGKDFPGTGIGLAIVAQIVRRHGGEVWAEGEVEKGATFYFSLPAKTV